jgi:2-dehydropantoate 2-reductase
MKILILGGGAVGTFIGAKLAFWGESVVVLSRNETYCNAVNLHGCSFVEKNKINQTKIKAYNTISSLFEKEDFFDLAIFCVKSFSTKPLLEELAPYQKNINQWLTMQNGIGNEEMLMEHFPAEKITSAVLTLSCSMEKLGEAKAENKGGIALASINGKNVQPFVAKVFKNAKFKIKICKNWKAMNWSKLFLNILLNGTCAILEMTPSEIISNTTAFQIERQMALEALSVLDALKIPLIFLPNQPTPLYAFAIKFFPEKILRFLFAKKAKTARGAKLPSLWLDFLRGKKETEAPFLYGVLAQKGKEKGIRTPIIETIDTLLEQKAKDPEATQKFKKNPEALMEMIKHRT